MHFMMARMALGVGEAGGFPAGIKAVTEWFPKKERAFAIGLFNAGTNIGAIVTPADHRAASVLAWARRVRTGAWPSSSPARPA
jgi:ACS family hexuronate transporter-like MFS transporter